MMDSTKIEAAGTVLPFHHYRHLDGFRGIAILLVLVGHAVAFDGSAINALCNLKYVAGLGVSLFFVLSGFLITGLLCREDRRTGTLDLRRFYVRRSLRIFPAFYCLMAVMSILMMCHLITDLSWGAFFISAFYLRNIFIKGYSLAHVWSLSMEEQFYLLWPSALKAMGRRRALMTVVILILLITFWRSIAIYFKLVSTEVILVNPMFRADCILSGCWIALVLDLVTFTGQKLKILRYITHPFFIIPILLSWAVFSSPYNMSYFTGTTFLSAVLLFGLAVAEPTSIFVRLLSSKWLCWIGTISYSLYLWQQLFIAMKVPSWGIIRTFPLDLIFTFACAIISYYVIETPFLRLKKQFEPERK